MLFQAVRIVRTFTRRRARKDRWTSTSRPRTDGKLEWMPRTTSFPIKDNMNMVAVDEDFDC